MSQKFILSAEKTTKKTPFFEQQRPKRFARKRSERDHSQESRRSKDNSISSHYIRNPINTNPINFNFTHDESSLFLDELSTSNVRGMESDRKGKRTMLARTNVSRDMTREECTMSLRIKILQTQMKAKEAECQRLQLQADQQRERRRRAEIERKHMMKEAAAFKHQNEQLMTQLKKERKQKQILNKQIQFLEKINYDEKTRNIQSYRQKHLEQENIKLRDKLLSHKTSKEMEYESIINELRLAKDSAMDKFRSMQSLVCVLRRTINHLKSDLIQQRSMTKQKVMNSEEYREQRERFKRFIEQYKDLKNENATLKKLVQTKEAQLVLSEQEQWKD